MKVANIAELRNSLSTYLGAVSRGEEVEVCKHNKPFARIVPLGFHHRSKPSRPGPGCGRGTGTITGELAEPLIPESDWEMLR